MDLPTWTDLFRIGRDEVLTRNSSLSRDAVEREGMDANAMVAAGAAMGDECLNQLAYLVASVFLDSALKDALDRLVFDRYGLVRKSASASVGSVQFLTPTASATTFTIPQGVVVQTTSGVQFITTESAIFAIGTEGPLTVAVRSALAGAGQNAKVGAITSIVSQISGAPGTLTVSNQFATAGDADAEEDDDLRDRARKFFVAARKGTLPALEAAALNVGGVKKAAAFEVLDGLGRPARLVQLVVTDAFTQQFADLSVVPPGYPTQSQLLATNVFNGLSDTRAAGIFVAVYVANVILQPIQLALAFVAGADVSTVALMARAAAANYLNALAPGKPLVVEDLQAALKLVSGLSYTGKEVVLPAGNVVPKPLQVLRTTLGLVSAVASQTDQPLITGNNPDSFVLAGA